MRLTSTSTSASTSTSTSASVAVSVAARDPYPSRAYTRVQMLANQLASTDSSSSSSTASASDASDFLAANPTAAIVPPAPVTVHGQLNPHIPNTEEAAMYSSRQIPLFQAKLNQNAKNTGLSIDEIVTFDIPRLQDFLPGIPIYNNVFVRTKGMKPKRGSVSLVTPDATLGMGLTNGAGQMIHTNQQTNTEQKCDDEHVTYNQIITDGEVVLLDIVRRSGLKKGAKSFIRAGPREYTIWKREEVVAAIVTCGGLCPGLNDVIAEIFTTLYYNYGVDRIYGIRHGLRGIWDPAFAPWIPLTPEKVKGIYDLGGTVLGSSRGGFNEEAIFESLLKHGVNQLYIIGGDGTHRAADRLQQTARARGIKMCVACVPKTIDNDIGVIDHSFGFNTAIGEARKAIQSAVVEASNAPNGLGIVQLMGRHAGYIAAHATLASRQVDMCLIPEIPFELHGAHGVLSVVESVLQRQGYGVIVVAEGAGSNLLQSTGVDESGNKKLPEIGKYLQSTINTYFKSKNKDISIKYHDPTYMIRSVPANAADSVYCMALAQNCVHGVQAGYTGFSSGLVNNRTVLIPVSLITATSPSYLNPEGRTWERVVSLTHQPMHHPTQPHLSTPINTQ